MLYFLNWIFLTRALIYFLLLLHLDDLSHDMEWCEDKSTLENFKNFNSIERIFYFCQVVWACLKVKGRFFKILPHFSSE